MVSSTIFNSTEMPLYQFIFRVKTSSDNSRKYLNAGQVLSLLPKKNGPSVRSRMYATHQRIGIAAGAPVTRKLPLGTPGK